MASRPSSFRLIAAAYGQDEAWAWRFLWELRHGVGVRKPMLLREIRHELDLHGADVSEQSLSRYLADMHVERGINECECGFGTVSKRRVSV